MKFSRLFILILSLVFCFVEPGNSQNHQVKKILAIGNSFSEDAVESYLHDIAKAENITLVIGNLNLGGCSLERHWTNASQNLPAYEFRKIDENGKRTTEYNSTFMNGLLNEDWDYISFQQVSPQAGILKSFEPYLASLLDMVKKNVKNKDVKYILHQTWAYPLKSDHPDFYLYRSNQYIMYEAIVDAVSKAAKNTGIDIIVPSGTAIQNGRTSVVGDNFCRDGFHLNMGIGRYTASCVWFEKLFGVSVIGNSFRLPTMSLYETLIAQYAAHYAVSQPKKITPVVITNY